jgi:LCP family protein required for cell wall assembly
MSKSNRTKRTALNVLCVVLALILAVMVAATIYVESMFNRMGTLDHETLSSSEAEELLNQTEETLDPDFTAPTLNPDDVTIPTEPAEVIVTGENIINIVLVGQDRREGQGRQRSDSMILCTINKEMKTITMTSFLRDIYVNIPGYYRQRLNVAYLLGGYKTLNATLEHNFGVSADHCIEVDFAGFENIINVLGGVDIDLTEAEAKYLNRRGNWDVQDGPVDWNLKAGVNTLTGAQALAYSRIRALDNDWGRTNRQRTVLTALLQKAKGMSLTQINDFANQVLPMIATDMSPSEITGYVMELFPLLGDLNIKTQTIPANGTWQYATINGDAVITVNFEKNQQILRELLGE